jgi:hypothetical protein
MLINGVLAENKYAVIDEVFPRVWEIKVICVRKFRSYNGRQV